MATRTRENERMRGWMNGRTGRQADWRPEGRGGRLDERKGGAGLWMEGPEPLSCEPCSIRTRRGSAKKKKEHSAFARTRHAHSLARARTLSRMMRAWVRPSVAGAVGCHLPDGAGRVGIGGPTGQCGGRHCGRSGARGALDGPRHLRTWLCVCACACVCPCMRAWAHTHAHSAPRRVVQLTR